jgi:DNA-binding cell septation regulator SpoVG
MQITEVRIYLTDGDLVRAYVAITFDNCLYYFNFNVGENQSQ